MLSTTVSWNASAPEDELVATTWPREGRVVDSIQPTNTLSTSAFQVDIYTKFVPQIIVPSCDVTSIVEHCNRHRYNVFNNYRVTSPQVNTMIMLEQNHCNILVV